MKILIILIMLLTTACCDESETTKDERCKNNDHHWVARYSKGKGGAFVSGSKTYIHDICLNCGKIVGQQKQGEP